MYGINPFSAQNVTSDVDPSHAPSIFGALPYPGPASANPALHSLVTFRFTSLSPSVLDCKVIGPNNETCYRVVTGGQAYTLLKDGAGRDIALVGWGTRPTVEAQAAFVAKQAVGQWLRLSADKSVRTMAHGGVCYSWAPLGRFVHLSAPGSLEWLARVTKSTDAVLLELTPCAIELGLIEAAVLATLLLMSGRTID